MKEEDIEMKWLAFLCAVLVSTSGCASVVRFLERDQAELDRARHRNVPEGSVCVLVADNCRYIPRKDFKGLEEPILRAAAKQEADWRRNRPMAAELSDSRHGD
jgi:hypothetical protein